MRALHRKFTLEIDGKPIAAELFRRTNKALTITGYTLDPAIRELTNIDKVFDWAVCGASGAKRLQQLRVSNDGNGFDGSDRCRYTIDQIEQIVREGPRKGANRSDCIPHDRRPLRRLWLGRGADLAHLQQFPQGIGGRYLREDRLRQEIARSAGKYAKPELPLSSGDGGWTGWEAKAPPRPEQHQEPPQEKEPDDVDPELEDDDLDDDDPDEEPREQRQPDLPPLYAHGDPDPRPLKSWLIKHLIPAVGHGLLSRPVGRRQDVRGVRSGGRAGHRSAVPRAHREAAVRGAADRGRGGDEVRLRLDAVVRRSAAVWLEHRSAGTRRPRCCCRRVRSRR